MSLRRLIALGLALLVPAPLGTATTANANPPSPDGLHVIGGDAWRPDTGFKLKWTNPPPAGSPLVAAHYRVRDPQGVTLEQGETAWLSDGIAALAVPRIPGIYSAEVWLEDAAGNEGPAASTQLRFDNVRPAAIEPKPPPGWIGRGAFPLRVHLGQPPGPHPISGIRGYAAVITKALVDSPCASADRCTNAETTLSGGATNDGLEIGSLPEGINYLHAVAVSGSGRPSPTVARAALRVDTTDPLTLLSGVPPGWTNRPAWLVASATDGASGMVPDGEGLPPITAIRVDGGPAITAVGESVGANVIEEGVHRIAYYARDAVGNANDGGGGNGHANPEPGAATVRIDRTPPAIAFANAQNPADPELLRAVVSDALAGADPSRGQIGVRRSGSGDRFERLPTMPGPAGELRARWNSDAYPMGTYEFRAVGYDAAGNTAATTRRRNGEAMALPNPLKATTALRAAIHRNDRGRAVPYGRRVLVRGRLVAGRNAPLIGKAVRITEHFDAGADRQAQVSSVLTGPQGEFSLRTAPGPSRTIAVAFDGSSTLSPAAPRVLDLKVRSRVRLRASAAVARVGGPPLIFSGRLVAPADTNSAAGKSVHLEFRLPGLPWAEFRSVRTDSSGRFRYAYRFSDDDSRGVRFQFRAYAPAQEGWPYEPAGSRPTLVRGR